MACAWLSVHQGSAVAALARGRIPRRAASGAWHLVGWGHGSSHCGGEPEARGVCTLPGIGLAGSACHRGHQVADLLGEPVGTQPRGHHTVCGTGLTLARVEVCACALPYTHGCRRVTVDTLVKRHPGGGGIASVVQVSAIEDHYVSPSEGQNLYDVLSQAAPHSELHWVRGGHASNIVSSVKVFVPAILEALVLAEGGAGEDGKAAGAAAGTEIPEGKQDQPPC
eukprot:TRINITY_DN1027_c0_g2_i5.p1 TRINITY_DN1027_c0_g2~~TRINITY_DN1027_c0_g2_i5.p1  ORF type:complete len:224 (+),score=33.26 TRINITY_DN1027_c0_g2_i5:30-701(+)